MYIVHYSGTKAYTVLERLKFTKLTDKTTDIDIIDLKCHLILRKIGLTKIQTISANTSGPRQNDATSTLWPMINNKFHHYCHTLDTKQRARRLISRRDLDLVYITSTSTLSHRIPTSYTTAIIFMDIIVNFQNCWKN